MKIEPFKHENVLPDGTFSDKEGAVVVNGKVIISTTWLGVIQPRTDDGIVEGFQVFFDDKTAISVFDGASSDLATILETHYEVVAAIERIRQQNEDTWPEGIKFIESAYGTGGFYELAKDITMAFEEKNAGREWDGEFFDEIEAFVNEYIQNL